MAPCLCPNGTRWRPVIDWVLVELRSGTGAATRASARAALLLRNGDVVDTDGSSPLAFPGITPGAYYVVLRHRNHLGVMSASAVSLSDSIATGVYSHDFTTSASQAYGSGSLVLLASGLFGLISGDATADGEVNALDRNATWNERNSTGYLAGDVTLDGEINALDRNYTWNNRNLVTQIP